MNIAYVRVSTVEQNEGRQKEGLSKYDIDKWFVEKVSAKDMNRPQLNTMLDFAREGDTGVRTIFGPKLSNSKTTSILHRTQTP